jgi:NAD(P)-dependent dehydrogenase (short-subunit alcohol dehydrogenase family)
MTQIEDERHTLILTGASRGIGHATVKRFASAGWRVITCSRHAFPENCPWAAGPEDHIQVDLGDRTDTLRAVREMRERLLDGKLHALVNNAAISPKGPRGERLGVLASDMELWRQVFEVNFFSIVWLARGLIEELTAAKGAIVNVTSIAGSRVHPFAGLRYDQSGTRRADARNGGGFRPARRARERNCAGRNRYRNSLTGHRENRRDHSAASPWPAGRSGEGDLLPLYRSVQLRHRRRAAHQRRRARMTLAARHD